MSARLGLAKLCLCSGAGALLGGVSVHVAEKPKKPRTQVVRSLPRKAPVDLLRPTEFVSLPCEPQLVPSVAGTQLAGPAVLPGFALASRGVLPPLFAAPIFVGGGGGGGGGGNGPGPGPGFPGAPPPGQVPEPAIAGLFGLGIAALLARRRFSRSARPRSD